MTFAGWKGTTRTLCCGSVLCVAASVAQAQAPADQGNPFASNPNLAPAQETSRPGLPNPQGYASDMGSRDLNISEGPQSLLNQQSITSANERNGRGIQNPLEPVPLTGFQRLVAASVGRVLPIFGSSLFSNVPSTFAPVDRIPVTPEYVVGPGDELLVRLWGQVTFDGHLTVDRTGNIYIPQVGAVRVAGIPFARLTDFLRTRIAHSFRNFDLNVNMGQLRSVQIFVVGEAKRPGSYTVSSLSTLVNTLFAAGGPSPTGSLRNIQVKRGSQTVATFDFYDLLLKGDKSKDIQLLSGDVVFIPSVGPMVAIAGSVDTQALYEIKPDSTVQEVLRLAGGFSTLANNQQIRLERLTQTNSRAVLDVKLDPGGLATPVQDGDIIEVSPIVDRFKDVVTLRGNVADPRRFSWFAGMKISDLIPGKDALLTRDYWQQRNKLGLPVLDSTPDVRRYAPDAPVAQLNGKGIAPAKSSLLLNAQGARDSDSNVYGRNEPTPYDDSVNSPLQSGILATSGVTVSQQNNSSRASGDDILDQSIDSSSRNRAEGVQDGSSSGNPPNSASGTALSASVTGVSRRFPVRNTVVLTAPDVDWAYAVVERVNARDLTTQLISFNLGRLVLDGDQSQNLELQPGDIITIFSKADVRVPQSQQTKYVRLEGEFLAAGTYSVAPGETLRQLVSRTGGISANAYLYGSEFTRESTRVIQQQRLNEYASDLDRRIKLAEANAANNTLNPQDQIADIAALQNARDVAMRLRQLHASGRIVLNTKPDSKSVAEIPDIPLEDGDTFVVPQVPLSVDVFGSVYTQTSFLYDPHKRAEDYIRLAGGGRRTADTHRSYIVRADGSVISRQFSSTLFTGNFGATHMYPGDSVVVPESVDKRPLLRNLVDVATIVGQFGLGVAAINVLR